MDINDSSSSLITDSQDHKKSLSAGDLIMFGIGNTIGAGIFALTGIAAQYAGPSLFLSFILSGSIAMTTAMMYAELSSRIPINGSAFSYTYVTFGELPAWVVGWNMNLRYGMSACGLARGMASYFNGLLVNLGVDVPQWMLGIEVFGIEKCSIEAVVFLIILNFIYTRGSEESKMFNTVFTVLKLITLFLIIIIAFSKFDSNNFTPFLIEEYGLMNGTVFAASIIFYGYLGFDFITTLSPDAKSPAKSVPYAVKTSTLLCMVIYIFTAISLAGMAPLQDFNADTAMADAFTYVDLDWASIVIYLCAFFGITAACFTNMIVSYFNSLTNCLLIFVFQ